MVKQGGWRLDEIVARLGGALEGDGSIVVSQVATLASAKTGQIAFLANPKYRQQLQSTNASAVIVPPKFAGDTTLPRIKGFIIGVRNDADVSHQSGSSE